jgi:hypothetical protein
MTWLKRAAGGEPEGWMDDSLFERIGLLPLVKRASGHVHISGLGLGLAVRAVLRVPAVRRVTVVEQAPEIVRMVGPYTCGDPRVDVVLADAYAWQPPAGFTPDICWHDVWTGFDEAVEECGSPARTLAWPVWMAVLLGRARVPRHALRAPARKSLGPPHPARNPDRKAGVRW